MSNIIDLINSITVSAASETKSYVHYNVDTGDIFKITSRADSIDGYSKLEVPYSSVKELMAGRKRMSDYKVEYDTALKQLALKEIMYEDSIDVVSDRLYRIPNSVQESDIKIINNAHEGTLLLLISKELQEDRHLYRRSNNIHISISVTANNDPNILYEHFLINLKDLLDNGIIELTNLSENKIDTSSFSVYTSKYFDTYSIEEV